MSTTYIHIVWLFVVEFLSACVETVDQENLGMGLPSCQLAQTVELLPEQPRE